MKTQTTHTPGPWEFNPDSDYIISQSRRVIIAKVASGVSAYLPNAKLIAAAPELLEACKAALPVIEALHEVPATRANMIRSAISKATK